jgi:serine/threonine protein kinase
MEKKTIYEIYEIQNELAEGTYGKVYSGYGYKTNSDFENKNGDSIIFKILKLDGKKKYQEECNKFIRENPNDNIVSIFDCIDIDCKTSDKNICKNLPQNQNYIVVLEYVMYKIDDYIDNVVETKKELFDVCMSMFLQICNGVKYLHDHKYIHTDLKPENIMINSSNKNLKPKDVKIIDLGTIQKINEKSKSELCDPDFSLGTPGFQDFCQYHADSKTKQDRKTIDIYQLGATFFDIYFNERYQYYDATTMTYPSPEENVIQLDDKPYDELDLFKKLIVDMTNKDWTKRPTIDGVIRRIKEIIHYEERESSVEQDENEYAN